MSSLPLHTPHFTRRRKRTVRSLLREATLNPGWGELTDDAKVYYVISALICDEAGRFTKAELNSALRDEPLVRYAESLLAGAA